MEHTKDRKQVLRIGIGGPVGSGKTALVVFSNLKTGEGLGEIRDFIVRAGLLE